MLPIEPAELFKAADDPKGEMTGVEVDKSLGELRPVDEAGIGWVVGI